MRMLRQGLALALAHLVGVVAVPSLRTEALALDQSVDAQSPDTWEDVCAMHRGRCCEAAVGPAGNGQQCIWASIFPENPKTHFCCPGEDCNRHNQKFSTRGNNDICLGDNVCGRYNKHERSRQCCACANNDCVINGVAWCRNAEDSACSDGVNENCEAGLVCGKIGKKEYKCCHGENDEDGVARCFKD